MRIILKKTYKYKVGEIYVKSDVQIDEEELTSLIKVTENLINNSFIDRCYDISRHIYHQMEDSISEVRTCVNPNRIKIRLIK